jgi:hypothetical protein
LAATWLREAGVDERVINNLISSHLAIWTIWTILRDRIVIIVTALHPQVVVGSFREREAGTLSSALGLARHGWNGHRVPTRALRGRASRNRGG